MSDRLLSRKELSEMLGLSKASIYRNLARGHLPAPLKIGNQAVRWRMSDIERFIENCPRAEIGNPNA